MAKSLGARVTGVDALSPFTRHLPVSLAVPDKSEIMADLQKFLEDGALTPIVDRVFPLREAVEAMRYSESGQARGRIVVVP